MFKPGSVNGKHVALQIQTREPIKSIRIASNFTKWSWLEMTNEDIVYIKTCKTTKWILINLQPKLFTARGLTMIQTTDMYICTQTQSHMVSGTNFILEAKMAPCKDLLYLI